MSDIAVPTGELIRALGNVLPHAPTSNSIEGLNQVRLEYSAVLTLVATDAYTLASDSVTPVDDTGPAWSFGLATNDAKDLLRALKESKSTERQALVTLDYDATDGTLYVRGPKGSGRFTPNHADYPRWEGLFPREDQARDTAGMSINPAMLARFSKLGGTKAPSVRLDFHGEFKPVKVTAGTFRGLIMPVRVPVTREVAA